MSMVFFASYAQETQADKIFEKYSSGKGVTSIVISKYMVTMFSNMETDDKDFDQMINGLKGIKLLSGKSADDKGNFYKDIQKSLPTLGYKELMYVTENGNQLKFFIHETNKKVDELLMVGVGENNESNVFIIIQGVIDLKTIHRIAKVSGLEKLENIDKKKE